MARSPDAADEFPPDADERAFRRNLLIVGCVHLLALTGFFLASKLQPKPPAPQLMWLDGGALASNGDDGSEPTESVAKEAESEPPPTATDPAAHSEPLPAPAEPPVRSEIVLPHAT